MTNYDIGIIGSGVAGSFAALKLAAEKNVKVAIIEIGRPPAKRRRQLEGFLGCLPNSDGKLYLSDIDKVSDLVTAKKTKSALNYFNSKFDEINTFKIIKDKGPSISMVKKIKKLNFDIVLNDYKQIYTQDIHNLSRLISGDIDSNKNIHCSFDNEILEGNPVKIHKTKGGFSVTTRTNEFKCKKLIIATGRSGWRWNYDLYKSFGIIDNNDIAKFGGRIEISSSYMKDFSKSNCSLIKDSFEVGPISWNGTIIPEDHLDLAISAFRSNENRWKSDKVSFNLILNANFENKGYEQTDRLGKLAFLLSNDRVVKERISTLIAGKSKLSIIPEYNKLIDPFKEMVSLIPELGTKGYFHFPTILPLPPKVALGNNLETEIEGLFLAGESAGITGILSAALMGIVAASSVLK